MSGIHDDDAEDRFLDQCLHEELGGRRPKDFTGRIAEASPARLDLAAATVDAAAAARNRWQRRRLFAAAAVLLLSVAGAWAWLAGTRGPQPELDRTQALLDAFHRVMPTCPATLRDAERRQEIAPEVLPVLRAILAQEHEQPVFGVRVVEFEVYAAELGDTDLLANLQSRANSGDLRAAAVLATARAATTDGNVRDAALTELAGHLAMRRDLEAAVVQALATAELTIEEAERFGSSLEDPGVRRHLVQMAHAAATSPRRLLGKPLELTGRLVDNRWFDTTSLRGRPVLVCYWASWCRPCEPVLEQVQRIHRQFPELAVVAISCDTEFAALAEHLAAHRDRDWIQFFDRTRPGWHGLAAAHGVAMVPFLMLLDRDGVVADVDLRGDLTRSVRRLLPR